MARKKEESQASLPLRYPHKKEGPNLPGPNPLVGESRKLIEDLRHIDAIHNATYGKVKRTDQGQNKPSKPNLFGEFLRKNYAKIENWKKAYRETGQIPPEFDGNEQIRKKFLRLIGAK